MAVTNKILDKMLDRLLAALVNGPSLNCRPYASRQRLDVVQLGKLGDSKPQEVLRGLLGPSRKAVIKARVPMPKGNGNGSGKPQHLKVAQSIEAADEHGIPLADGPIEEKPGDEQKSPERAWLEQQAVLNKLHTIAEDARTYEQDTGVSVLNVGFPLLSLPPGTFGGGNSSATRRVLAPLAFIPISITVKRGAAPAIELACKEEGVDLVMPNTALFAWLEQQTGKPVIESDEDESGTHPWREICEIVQQVCLAMDIAVPEEFEIPATTEMPPPPERSFSTKDRPPEPIGGADGGIADSPTDRATISKEETDSPEPKKSDVAAADDAAEGHGSDTGVLPVREPQNDKGSQPSKPTDLLHGRDARVTMALPADLELHPAPKSDESDDAPKILCSAVLGLFPMANQGLLRDTQAMIAADNLSGPVESFIRQGVSLDVQVVEDPAKTTSPAPAPVKIKPVVISEERFVSGSDPCQARAVRLARECRGLVVHGPPGTGKSQTITNIIGDHLSRGQRVLVVCDKRTALDVVFNRLSHMGLGNLCALVHDPRRDQREMYKSIRQQLDELHEASSDAKAEAKLAKVDAELQEIHDELSRYRDSLIRRPSESGLSFHDLVAEWLSLEEFSAPEATVEDISLQTLDTYANAVSDVLKRGEAVGFGANPWVTAAGIPLGDFLAQPMSKIRALGAECDEASRAADATIDPAIPPFAIGVPLKQQADGRMALAEMLPRIIESTDAKVLARWAGENAESLARARRKLDEASAFVQTLLAGALDAELLANVRNRPLESLPISEHLVKLAAYQEIAKKWYAFLPFRAKREASPVINSYGLTRRPDNAERVRKFLNALRARLELSILCRSLEPGSGAGTGLRPDDTLGKSLADHARAIDLMAKVRTDAALTGLADLVAALFTNPAPSPPYSGERAGVRGGLSKDLTSSTPGAAQPPTLPSSPSTGERDLRAQPSTGIDAGFHTFIEGLRKSAPRATALEKLEDTTTKVKLFDTAWLTKAHADFRAGKTSADIFTPLRDRIDTLEGILRIRQGLSLIPVKLCTAVDALLNASVEAGRGGGILRREALAGEISARLKADPHLQEIDGHRLSSAFDQYRKLDDQKRQLTRAAIQHRWVSRQQERLLAQTGTRLNSLGADLRRRLMLRGERAIRLRQVIAVGSKIDGGDPLFDLCPIWLCSPETVAQVFPRQPVFDVLVFDEASQLRLEESLPVLVRGKRVVIAGDPKQLPPTRFFESAVAASEEEDAQTDQDLFEQHQGEVEDLLGAALGLDIQQCYLDVHYRSRHADLIAFSNDHFYGSRLQPIPGPPSANSLDSPPVQLEHVGGIYERRRNEMEAGRIVEIIRDLLSQKDPPSIGIACFNLVQRDLVAEKLDELAAEDAAFAKRLEKARTRQGEGSFEGLFIKNLENVQGDERDYIIISTTYGPDKVGKFYRRFGPLGRAGGGRRLNVLITRARDKVHIVTSIPRDSYRTLPEIEAGQTPGGTWLLLAYLKFAEELQRNGQIITPPASVVLQPPTQKSPDEKSAVPHPPQPASVNILATKAPSTFAQAFAKRLAVDHGVASDVHWGNEGFCIDLALRHGNDSQHVGTGVLCDAARFAAADDPMQWDIFRTGILEGQGWKLHRLWTPHFFRDPTGVTEALVRDLPDASHAAKRTNI